MIVAFLFILGLIIGSFLAALTYRLPKNISISKGRSKCPNCDHQIASYDNIPLLSFLLLLGHCRHCHSQISFRYLLIELATVIIFVIVGFNIFNLIFACILLSIFVIDLEHQIIPDELVFVGLAIFAIYNIQNTLCFSNLLAGFLSALLLLTLNLVTKGRGMGLGDVKLALLLGSFVGINLFLNWLFFSFVAGAVVGILLIIGGKATMKQKIAFGPFLIIGFLLVILIK